MLVYLRAIQHFVSQIKKAWFYRGRDRAIVWGLGWEGCVALIFTSPTRQICIDRNVEKKKSSSQALLGQAYSTLPCFFYVQSSNVSIPRGRDVHFATYSQNSTLLKEEIKNRSLVCKEYDKICLDSRMINHHIREYVLTHLDGTAHFWVSLLLAWGYEGLRGKSGA